MFLVVYKDGSRIEVHECETQGKALGVCEEIAGDENNQGELYLTKTIAKWIAGKAEGCSL